MRPLFGALVALIFYWRRINAQPPTPSTAPGDDWMAPITAVLTQSAGDLMFAIAVAGLVSFVVWTVWNFWR